MVSGGEGCRKGKNEPRQKSWLVVTHRQGLPFHGSPLCVLLPLRVSSIEPDDDGPTSLRRGEGHRVCLSSGVGEVARWRGGDSGQDEGRMNQASTVDAVDG